MDIELEQYEQALVIDKNDLDNAIMQQPETFYRVALEYAQARDEVEALKDEVDRTDSNLSLRFREEAEAKNEKTTEGRIASMVITDQDHVEVVERYRAAKLQAERLGALKDAFNQRAGMLRELTNLYVSSYYTNDSLAGPANKQREMAVDKAKKTIAGARRALHKKQTAE